MSNIVMSIIDYIKSSWKDTDQDIVKAVNINGWETALENHTNFLKRFSWQPNTHYEKGSVILYPFGLNTKLVSKNAGTSGSKEPTWSDAQGEIGKRTVTDNDIIWEEKPMNISSDTTPVGTIKQQLWQTAPPGYLKLDESHVLNRSEYPELWDYVQKYYPLITEVDWQKQKATQTSVGFFSTGDGETTFRTPILLDFARGGSTPGTYTKDQNKEHTHTGTTKEDGVHRHKVIGSNTSSPGNGRAGEIGSANDNSWFYTETDGAHQHSLSIGNSGGSEVLVKNIIMPYFLRVKEL